MDRQAILDVYSEVVDACDPESAVAYALAENGFPDLLTGPGRVIVVAIGKAAPAMARGVARVVGRVDGLAVCDHDEECPVEVLVGDHPIPGERSLAAGRRILDTARAATPSDTVLFLVSGGGSALAESLVDGVSRSDLASATEALIGGGVPIEGINEVRAALSEIKAGRLAAATGTTNIGSLVLSDVVGAGPEVVASGPSIPSPLGGRAPEVVSMFRIRDRLPKPVRAALDIQREAAVVGDQPIAVVGSTEKSAAVAQAVLERFGVEPTVLTTELAGSTTAAVDRVLAALDWEQVVVATGETVVEVSGDGLGGRNQHAALLAAIAIEGTDTVFAALGTDGRDGPTDAAGGIVDGGSARRMRAAGVDPQDAVRRCDSYRALEASGDIVRVGPTGTNVADIWIAGRALPRGRPDTP